MNDKEQAYAFSKALEIGAAKLEQINSWADSIILRDSEPDIHVIDLAGCSSPSKAISHLNEISAGAEESLAHKYLYRLYHKALSNNWCPHSSIARSLFFLAIDNSNIEHYSDLINFWDAIDLAMEGSYGNPEEEKAKLLGFLNENKA